MTTPRNKPRIDSSDAWNDVGSKDIAETIAAAARAGRPAATSPAIQINTVHGDVINLGTITPEALAEFLANRRRTR